MFAEQFFFHRFTPCVGGVELVGGELFGVEFAVAFYLCDPSVAMLRYTDVTASVISAAVSVAVVFGDCDEPKVLFSVVNFVCIDTLRVFFVVDDIAVGWCPHDNLMKTNRRGFSIGFLYHRLWISALVVIPTEVFYFIKVVQIKPEWFFFGCVADAEIACQIICVLSTFCGRF